MKFSQRIGKTPEIKQLQVDAMDVDLRNGLWDGLKIHAIDLQRRRNSQTYDTGPTQFDFFCKVLWLEIPR